MIVKLFKILQFIAIAQAAISISDEFGTQTSEGYPTSFKKGASWRFRTPGATTYDITFEDIDIDSRGCSSTYIVVYNDEGLGLPVRTLCDGDTGAVVTVHSSKITVALQVSYSGAEPGKRGLKFHYSVNGAGQTTSTTVPITTTTTEPITDENGSTIPTTTTTSTTRPTTTTQPSGTNPAGYETAPPRPGQDPSAFPLPDPTVDERCSLTFVDPEINDFDYVMQDQYVRGEINEWDPSNTFFNPNPKVINGEVAVPHSFPWQVTLGDNMQSYCGGTIINDQFVVTAAHCGVLVFIGAYSGDFIQAGLHDKRQGSGSPEYQKIEVEKVFNHPLYQKKTKHHDVSVLKLKNRLRFGQHVQPACMAHVGWRIPEGFMCVVTGWGQQTSSAGSTSNVLRQAALNHLNDESCFDLYQNANLDTTPDMQCFGTRQSQGPNYQGACNGDSGGPLHCYIHGKWYWSGIVSFGASGCDTNIASIYGKVYNEDIQEFINAIIAENSG